MWTDHILTSLQDIVNDVKRLDSGPKLREGFASGFSTGFVSGGQGVSGGGGTYTFLVWYIWRLLKDKEDAEKKKDVLRTFVVSSLIDTLMNGLEKNIALNVLEMLKSELT